MRLRELDNLVKINKLKVEPADQKEFVGLLNSAQRRLQDAKLVGLSEDSQFDLVYGAAHALALAAMRWHGYRSEHRYLVFQCLVNTVGLEAGKWRVLDKCHQQRNLAEYEGHLEITPLLLKELVLISEELFTLVENLGPIDRG